MTNTTIKPHYKTAAIAFAIAAVCFAIVALALFAEGKSEVTLWLFAVGAILQGHRESRSPATKQGDVIGRHASAQTAPHKTSGLQRPPMIGS
jgi:hypothetical protein